MEQSKTMKSTCSNTRSGCAGRVRFQVAKTRPAEGEELYALVSNAVKEVLKSNKHLKSKASSDSGSEDEQENSNFDNLNSGKECRETFLPRSNAAEVP